MAEDDELARELARGVEEGVAPAAVLLLWREDGPRTLCAGQADPETVFDLASLTKPLATALLALDLAASERLTWEITLEEVLGHAVPPDKKGLTLRRLLTHSGGYPAHRPYFQLLEKQPRPARRGLLKAMLMNEPLEYPPGSRALYSDLGYLLAGMLLEEVGAERLDLACRRIYGLLGVEGPRYLPLDEPLPWPVQRIAPCGSLPGRDHIQGQVEDENAFALGGVAGHAGLFGTAGQVAAVMDALCRAARREGPWPPELVGELLRRDPQTPHSPRTLGFDTPQGPQSAAGPNPPSGVVGHLGFTGVSLWWHPASNRGVVLLTNRVALGRDNQGIAAFRRRIHRLAWPLLGF